jgi:hypothetical protein
MTDNKTMIVAVAIIAFIIIVAAAIFVWMARNYSHPATTTVLSTIKNTSTGIVPSTTINSNSTTSSSSNVQGLQSDVNSSPMQDYNVTSNENASAVNTS